MIEQAYQPPQIVPQQIVRGLGAGTSGLAIPMISSDVPDHFSFYDEDHNTAPFGYLAKALFVRKILRPEHFRESDSSLPRAVQKAIQQFVNDAWPRLRGPNLHMSYTDNISNFDVDPFSWWQENGLVQDGRTRLEWEQLANRINEGHHPSFPPPCAIAIGTRDPIWTYTLGGRYRHLEQIHHGLGAVITTAFHHLWPESVAWDAVSAYHVADMWDDCYEYDPDEPDVKPWGARIDEELPLFMQLSTWYSGTGPDGTGSHGAGDRVRHSGPAIDLTSPSLRFNPRCGRPSLGDCVAYMERFLARPPCARRKVSSMLREIMGDMIEALALLAEYKKIAVKNESHDWALEAEAEEPHPLLIIAWEDESAIGELLEEHSQMIMQNGAGSDMRYGLAFDPRNEEQTDKTLASFHAFLRCMDAADAVGELLEELPEVPRPQAPLSEILKEPTHEGSQP